MALPKVSCNMQKKHTKTKCEAAPQPPPRSAAAAAAAGVSDGIMSHSQTLVSQQTQPALPFFFLFFPSFTSW